VRPRPEEAGEGAAALAAVLVQVGLERVELIVSPQTTSRHEAGLRNRWPRPLETLIRRIVRLTNRGHQLR
jgi:hypothetical protein